jgi:large subunit ribosomal protein L18
MRKKRTLRIRARIQGTKDRPRVAVYRSNKALSAQIIDDATHTTLCAAAVDGKTLAKAKELGTALAQMAVKKGITAVVFDRSGYRYHGSIRQLADAIREGGVQV